MTLAILFLITIVAVPVAVKFGIEIGRERAVDEVMTQAKVPTHGPWATHGTRCQCNVCR